MNILIEIFAGLSNIVITLINIYIWVVIIHALLSFVNPDPYNPIVQFINRITEPAYQQVRKRINTNINGIDLAPLIIIVVLQVVIVILNSLLGSLL